MDAFASKLLLEEAAAAGDEFAQFDLGVSLEEGWYGEQNLQEAARLYREAAERGHGCARHNITLMSICRGEPPNEAMMEDLRQRSEQGDADAQNNLGLCFFYGLGVEQDYNIARTWYERGARSGSATAQFNLGGLYYEGNGVEKDYDEARRWYVKAAEQRHELALLQVGNLYRKGHGVEPNDYRAFVLFLCAYRRGSMRAAVHLGYLFAKGIGTAKSAKEAVSLFLEAIVTPDSAGSPPQRSYLQSAYFWLGKLTEEGEQTPQPARYWYRKGESVGCQHCAKALKRLKPVKHRNSNRLSSPHSSPKKT